MKKAQNCLRHELPVHTPTYPSPRNWGAERENSHAAAAPAVNKRFPAALGWVGRDLPNSQAETDYST
jgi:hypothetical protein